MEVNMKKIIALILVVCICFGMVGCSAITTAHAATDEEVVEEEEKDLGDILTEVAAGLIAAWLTSEFEEYINQQSNADETPAESEKIPSVYNRDTIQVEK